MNFFDTYYLASLMKDVPPKKTFFRDRYFPTAAGDIFATDKVVTEYKKGDQKLAAFVSDRAGDIPIEREGYSVTEYEPSYIAPSRILTLDDLKKRGFGEALYSQMTPEQRQSEILRGDLEDLSGRIDRRLEWMCAQTMINNACTMQTYVDAATQGETKYVKFFGASSDHTFTINNVWNGQSGDVFSDVRAMCRMLSSRGLPASDLVLGSDTADALLANTAFREVIKRDSGIAIGYVEQANLPEYDGVAYMGSLNFGGFRLNVFSVDEQYVDESNQAAAFFPAKAAMVTAPGCGHLMFGAVTQIDFGEEDFSTHAGDKIPKISIEQNKDVRKMRLASRPLAAPKQYCPYIYAAGAVS